MTQTMNFHNVRDSKGRFVSKNRTPAQQAPAKIQTTHYIFVLDRSGSMASCIRQACETVNSLANTFLSESAKHGNLRSIFSLVDFDSNVTVPHRSLPVLPNLSAYTRGSTALNDAIGTAIDMVIGGSNEDAYHVTVITDGEENVSTRHTLTSIRDYIKRAYATDRFTLGFNCPYGYKNKISSQYGVPLESINEWENTVQGTQYMANTNTYAATNYVVTRSSGATKTLSYFSVDANNFAEDKLKKLTRFSPKHRKVEKESSIEEFFGNEFYLGKGFYELTKIETIQGHKDLILQEKTTGNYYKSSPSMSVRQFLGMPLSGDAKVDPLNLGYYKVFVQSTSNNRKLVRGTTVLFF